VAGRGALAGMQAMKRQSPAATMTHTLLSGKILAAQAQEECQKPVTMTSSSSSSLSHFAEFPIQVEASTSSFAMVPTRSAAVSPRLAIGTCLPAAASPIRGMLP
jgi:D-arabinose 5-phosphate isomerase GutQ